MIYLKYLAHTHKKVDQTNNFFHVQQFHAAKWVVAGSGMRGDDERVYSRIKNAFKKLPTLSNIANNNIGVDKKKCA